MHEKSADLSHTVKLLSEAQFELEELHLAAEIEVQDLKLGKVLGEGGLGKIYLAYWATKERYALQAC